MFVVGHGGRTHALKARLNDKREFAGYWEYLLDEALFTVPAHPHWSGAPLVGADGRLLGIGSLLVQEEVQGNATQGNMFVPIDLLAPILDDLVMTGRSSTPPRPWLGMYTQEAEGQMVVAGLAKAALRKLPACVPAIWCWRSRPSGSRRSTNCCARSGGSARPAPRSRSPWDVTARWFASASARPIAATI